MQDRDEYAPLRSFGRVKGRALKPRQAALIETLLPQLSFDLSSAGFAIAADAPSPLRAVLEIGFGGGEHLVAQAARDREAVFIGAEPFLNGLGSCLRHIEESGVTNVRLHHGDVRDVIAALPNASLDLVYILFPDPWPKARHWKRRLIQPDFVAALGRVVKRGGQVRFATDWKAYAAWTLETFLHSPDFAWTAERAAEWRAPWLGHVRTRYEEKALGDTAPVFFAFMRAR